MSTEEDQALELARILREAENPEVVKALRKRAVHSDSALARRGALLALEGRAPTAWWEPVTRAYKDDPDASVRQEAADVLARALANPAYRSIHAAVRMTLIQGLGNLS